MPRQLRPAFSALWTLDLAFADVVATSTESRLGAIRLAWWRERLEELDAGKAAPAEPRLQSVANELRARGISGKELSHLEDAWLPLLEAFPWGAPQREGLALRGRTLFRIGARLLGAGEEAAETAGELWSLADGARHCSDPQSRRFLVQEASTPLASIPKTMPRQLRPLTILAALAAVDLLGKRGGLVRLLAAVRHRLFGTLPAS